MEQISNAIKALREKYPDEDSQGLASGWEKEAKRALLVANLKDHDGVKIIIDGMTREAQELEETLRTDKNLFKDAEGIFLGRLIHARREWCLDFIHLFDQAEKRVAGIEKKIGEALQE